jgi:hypothetical protein
VALEMKSACESCDRSIEHSSDAYICSYECTFCPTCRARLKLCPNCGGELLLRPRRQSEVPSNSHVSVTSTLSPLPIPHGLVTPYVPRPTRLISIYECYGWKLKVYEIRFDSHSIPSDQVNAILTFVENNVPWPSVSTLGNNAGFVIIHRGQDAMWLMVHIWQSDILIQFAYQATLSTPVDFIPLRVHGLCACVWELEVVKHERDAWVRCAMGSDDLAMDTYWNDNLFLDSDLK